MKDSLIWAHEANPQAPLLINDYMVVVKGRFQEHYKRLIDSLLAQHAPLHAIGIQAHEPNKGAYWFSPDEIWESCELFGSQTGRPIYFTEFCYTSDPAADIRGKYRQVKWSPEKQGEAIEEFYRVAFGHPAVAGIVYFGMGDDDPLWLPKQGLLDESFQPKPAWERLKRLIKEEWSTRQAGSTDAEGAYAFRGFFGQYEVCVTAAGKHQTFTAHLEKGQPNVWCFILD